MPQRQVNPVTYNPDMTHRGLTCKTLAEIDVFTSETGMGVTSADFITQCTSKE